MPLDAKLKTRLERVLSTLDDQGTLGPRLTGDALRLWQRLNHFFSMNLVTAEPDREAMELACYALQLPPRQSRGIVAGRLGRTSLRDRCEQSAELLVSVMGNEIEEGLLDRTTRMVHEIPQRSPMIEEAKLLADALDLDDFGVTGLVQQIIQIGLQGEGVADVATGWEKREAYGYWEARLKDGFHFEPIRTIARQRLANARQVVKLLDAELTEDRG